MEKILTEVIKELEKEQKESGNHGFEINKLKVSKIVGSPSKAEDYIETLKRKEIIVYNSEMNLWVLNIEEAKGLIKDPLKLNKIVK
jgi:hypothetical protein